MIDVLEEEPDHACGGTLRVRTPSSIIFISAADLYRLRGYMSRRPSRLGCRRPSDQECQMAFLNWVAYDTRKEHLKCPMYNCRQGGFDDTKTFLNHVSACSWLPEADYWCPDCCQQEHFGVSGLQGRTFTIRQSSKESKLRKACHFFKRFGRLGCHNSETSSPSCDSYGELEGSPGCSTKRLSHTFGEKPEMEATTLHSQVKELDDTSRGTVEQYCNGLTPSNGIRKSNPRNSIRGLRISTQAIGPSEVGTQDWKYSFAELTGSPGHFEQHASGLGSSILDRDIPQIDRMISPMSLRSAQSEDQCSPTSVSPMESPIHRVGQHGLLDQDQRWSPSTQNTINDIDERTTGQVDEGLHGTTINEPTPKVTFWRNNDLTTSQHEAFAGYRPAFGSTQAQVEMLHQLVYMLMDRWQGYSNDWPDLHVLSNGLNMSCPLIDGLRGLKGCLSGNFPTTLRDMISFVHLAYACAYFNHGEDTSFDWDAFYQDTLRWGESISDKQDRYRFSKIVEVLYTTPQNLSDLMVTLLPAEPHSGQGSTGYKSTVNSSPELHLRDSHRSRMDPTGFPVPASDLELPHGSGVVVECCTRFLDREPILSSAQPCTDADLHMQTLPTQTFLKGSMVIPPTDLLLAWPQIDPTSC